MIWTKNQHDPKLKSLLEADGVSSIFAELIAGRDTGILSKSDIPGYAEADLGLLEDPTLIPNVETATDVVLEAAGKGRSAMIFGDYDADGVISSYMMKRLLHGTGYERVDCFIPDRIAEGYGLNDISVANFLRQCSIEYDLVVALDCGSSSRKQIEMIKKIIPNTKVVVLDHHIVESGEFSDNADAVLNPRLGTATHFCTGGVVYQFARAVGSRIGIGADALLPYAAITTVADVCELKRGNRILVKNGLQAMEHCTDPGLRMIMEKASINPAQCTVRDIGFGIGPLINAAGRLKHASIALNALQSLDIDTAKHMAASLAHINEERKVLQNKTFEKALEKCKGRTGMSSALIYDEKWHTGVVGIVASKICEKFGVPTICFGRANGKIKGSARSIQGVHVKEIMDRCSELFSKHGGHEMAAGATLKDDRLEDAWDVFDTEVAAYLKEKGVSLGHKAFYDTELTEGSIRRLDGHFCSMLESLGPFGNGNERPVFRANGLKCFGVSPWGSGTGAFFRFEKLSLDCYGRTGDADPMNMKGKHLDILFDLERSFADKTKWAANIRHCRMSLSVG